MEKGFWFLFIILNVIDTRKKMRFQSSAARSITMVAVVVIIVKRTPEFNVKTSERRHCIEQFSHATRRGKNAIYNHLLSLSRSLAAKGGKKK